MKQVQILLCVIGLLVTIENIQASGVRAGFGKLANSGIKNAFTGSNLVGQKVFTGAVVGSQSVGAAPLTESIPPAAQASAGKVSGGRQGVPVSTPLSVKAIYQSNFNQTNLSNSSNIANQTNSIQNNSNFAFQKKMADNQVRQAMAEPSVQNFSQSIVAREVVANSPVALKSQQQLQGTLFTNGLLHQKNKLPASQKQEVKLVEKLIEIEQASYDPNYVSSQSQAFQQQAVIDAAPQSSSVKALSVAKKQLDAQQLDAFKNSSQAVAVRQARANRYQPEMDLGQTIFANSVKQPIVKIGKPELTQSEIYAQSASNYYARNKASLDLGKSINNNYGEQQQVQSSWQGQRNSPGLNTTLIASPAPVDVLPQQSQVIQPEVVINPASESVTPVSVMPKAVSVRRKQLDAQQLDAFKNSSQAVAVRQVRANRYQPEMDLGQTIFANSVKQPIVKIGKPELTQSEIYAQSASNYYARNKASLDLGKSMNNNYGEQQQVQSSWQGQKNSPGLDTTLIASPSTAEVLPQQSQDFQQQALIHSVPELVAPVNIMSKINNKRKYSEMLSESQVASAGQGRSATKLVTKKPESKSVSFERQEFVKAVDVEIKAEVQNLPPQPSRWMIIRMLQRLKAWVLNSFKKTPSAAQEAAITQNINQATNRLVREAANNNGQISQQAVTLEAQALTQDLVNMSVIDASTVENQV